jgi:hypothetical protein
MVTRTNRRVTSHAKRVNYAGKTRDGDPMSFTLVGNKLTKLKAYAPRYTHSS